MGCGFERVYGVQGLSALVASRLRGLGAEGLGAVGVEDFGIQVLRALISYGLRGLRLRL